MSNQDLDWLAAQQLRLTRTDSGARERALTSLTQHISTHPRKRGLRLQRPLRRGAFGLATTGAAALAAAAVVLLAGNGSRATDATQPGAPGNTSVAAVQPTDTGSSQLVRLADYVSQTSVRAGNATLVARTSTTSGGNAVTVYDLYADNGQYFFSRDESGLQGQVSAGHNLAGGLFAREIAAAKSAATGNAQTAAQDMADAAAPGNVISATQPANSPALTAKQKTLSGASLFDNYVWENSQDALIAGSGEPQVRAGVLRILATLPDVTVTSSTSAGQPTLVLTAGIAELGNDNAEQLTINATTGVPIRSVGGQAGQAPTTTVGYKVSRVTLANLPSGSGTGSSD